jgi:hypothetical protein
MKRWLLIVLAATCALARPASAYAQGDFLDWLEGLSGPGPFHGYFRSVNSRALCTLNDGGKHSVDWWCGNDTDQRIKTVLGVEVAWPDSDAHIRFADATSELQNTGRVRATRVLFNYYYRFNSMLDVGVGAGWITFTASDFDNQVHPILTPFTLTFTPFGFVHDEKYARLGRVFRVKFSERYILRDILAKDFGSNISKYFQSGGEFNRGISFGVDFWPFADRRRTP